MKNNIGKYIKQLRNKQQLSLGKLAKKSGVSKSHLSRIERDVRGVTPELIKKIAKPLNTTYEFLMAKAGYINIENLKSLINAESKLEGSLTVEHPKEIEIIPVLNCILPGNSLFDQEHICDYKKVPYEDIKGGDFFYFKISDNSMINNRIRKEDLALVQKQSSVEEGEIAVVMIDASNAQIRKIYKTDNKIILQADNPKYEPIILSQSKVEIIGKVIKVSFNL